MLKKTTSWLFLLFFIFLTPIIVYFIERPVKVEAIEGRVAYNLPYPGILPDHPFYFLKAIRDRITDWLTRDNLKKAELYLLYSDKRVSMAQLLSKKGKINLAISTFSKGEKYFLKIPSLLEKAKKQGVSPPSDFVQKLKLANDKHYEVAQSLIKEFPQGVSESMREIVRLNEEVKKQLERF